MKIVCRHAFVPGLDPIIVPGRIGVVEELENGARLRFVK